MDEYKLKNRVISVVLVLIGLTILFGVIGMVFFWRNATTPKKIISVATGDAVVLIESERERITLLPQEGLPEELLEVTPVYEAIYGGRSEPPFTQAAPPLNAARLYENGDYFIFSARTGNWKHIGKVKSRSMPELIYLLTSESVIHATSDAGTFNPVERVLRLYRINVTSFSKEVIYGYYGKIDPVFSEIDNLILKNLI